MAVRTLHRFTALSALGMTALLWSCGSPAPAPLPSVPTDKGPRLYISDETGGAVAIVDPVAGTVIGRIPVGKRPRGIRLSHDGSQLLVALSGSPIAGPGVDESKLPPPDRSADGIGIVDLSTGKVGRMLRCGQDPETFDLSADGATLYVSNEETEEMSVVDVASGDIRSRVKVGDQPEGVTLRPGSREVYVTSEGTNEVTIADTTTGKVIKVLETGARPRAVAFTADGATAFVTNENGASITVVDAAAHKVATVIAIPRAEGAPAAAKPMGLVLAPGGAQMFASLGRGKAIAVLDVASRKLLRTIDNVGDRPWGITINPDGRTLYTANGPSSDVSIVDVAAGTVTKRVAVGGSPWGVVFSAGR